MKGNLKKIYHLLLTAVLFLSAVNVAWAQNLGVEYANNLGLLSTTLSPQDLLVNIVRYLLTFLAIIAVIIILYAGWLWMTSGGSPDRLRRAKRVLVSAIIGLILIITAFAIVQFITNFVSENLSESCTPAASRPCGGCQGAAGTQVCQGDGSWGTCSTDCGGLTPVCCSYGCDSACSTVVPDFVINQYNPPNGITTVRNQVVRVVFSRPVNAASVSGNFHITKTGGTGTAPDGAACGSPFDCASDNCVGSICQGNEVAYSTLNIGGNRIDFTPLNSCPAPNGAWHCFDQNASYTITADNGPLGSGLGILRSGDNRELTCDGFNPCTADFNTNDIVDTAPPANVNLSRSGNLCLGYANNLAAAASDDSWISTFEFSDNNSPAWTFSDNSPVCSGGTPNQCTGAAVWFPTALGGYNAGVTYQLKVTATDADSNSNSAGLSEILRPAHCCNGVLDASDGEAGIDCGGDCAACQGAACGISMNGDCGGPSNPNCDDSRCSSGFCSCGTYPNADDPETCQDKGYAATVGNSCCVCEDAPIIDWVTPVGGFCNDAVGTFCRVDTDCPSGTCNTATANGAVGNLVTIGGRYFGSYAPGLSEVRFDAQTAPLAETANPACVNSWTDSQIIVSVPAGAGSNPEITVTAGNGYSDTTGNGRGNIINFQINGINRPGLCDLAPTSGRLNDTLTYSGLQLNGATARFGNLTMYVGAIGSSFAAQSGTAQVPNIGNGLTTTYVLNGAGVNSNFLNFTKLSEPSAGPAITSFDPLTGNTGQYVTIYGSGFGSAAKSQLGVTHHVYFDNDLSNLLDGVEADYEFPAICSSNLWTDKQIIVKVPSGLTNGPYYLVVNVDSWADPLDSSGIIPTASTDPTFDFNSGALLLPSLCRISPTYAPIGSPLDLWGEYFGTPPGSLVRFQYNIDQTGGTWTTSGGTDNINDIAIPGTAVSGPVRVVKSGQAGNSLNLTVGSCLDASDPDAACGTDLCCGAGSLYAGACVTDQGAPGPDDDCYASVSGSVYEWDFSTLLGLPCDLDDGAPGCQADRDTCVAHGYSFCDPAVGCTCQNGNPSCDLSPDDPVCDADNDLCTSLGFDFCDPSLGCRCNDSGVTDDSCQGRAQRLGLCLPDLYCPNSPGVCSPYTGGQPYTRGNCDDGACDSVGACGAGTCVYDAASNRCANPGDTCDQSASFTDNSGRTFTRYCALYGNPVPETRWYVNTPGSCPDTATGWTNIGNGRCIENSTTCNLCDSGFECAAADLCLTGDPVCPSGSTCSNAYTPAQCEAVDTGKCECCCDISNPTLDCCAGLECKGDCGSDRVTDTNSYGYCSECWVDTNGNGSPDAADQSASDAACNCDSTAGKYCDMNVDVDSDGTPDGVCRDCAYIGSQTDVCTSHTTCCVDNMSSDNCRGLGTGNILTQGSTNYCAYYDCDATDRRVCDPAAAVTGRFRDTATCDQVCDETYTPIGEECIIGSNPYCETGADTCGSYFSCLPDTANQDCRCCCDPNSPVDACKQYSPDLYCSGDKAPCGGPDRGLCCGCSEDADCGTPADVGCSFDSCCHNRPSVVSHEPEDDADTVCRNTQFRVTFDQPMNIGSLESNVIVLGDFGTTGPCPAGTGYLARADDPLAAANSPFGRVMNALRRMFRPLFAIAEKLNPAAEAYTGASFNHVYCQVFGSVKGANDVDSSTMTFVPGGLLAADTTYYVIIKGDENLDSSGGVLSSWGVGMNGPVDSSPQYQFNMKSYPNSYIWSFTTLSDQAANSGVCEIDHVDMIPTSYLFQKLADNPNEDDTDPAAASFDTARDRDKAFRVYARNADGQTLASVPGYAWDWSWAIIDPSVLSFAAVTGWPDNGPERLLEVNGERSDGRTFVQASINLTDSTYSTAGNGKTGNAEVFIFLCDNPWPPVSASGQWAPWRDVSTNAQAACDTGTCSYTNYEIYYCRDTGNFGTVDDLPAIESDDTVIRGQTLLCSDGSGPCGSIGAPCGTGGVCEGILKDAYFFRESTTGGAVTDFAAAAESGGGAVRLTWSNSVTGGAGYKVYWGASPGRYDDFAKLTNSPLASDQPQVVCSSVGNCIVSGLDNNHTYYFNLTSYTSAQAESGYYGEVSALPLDTSAPGAPSLTEANPRDKEVDLSWSYVSGTASYEVLYGVTSGGPYGYSQNVGSTTGVIVAGLTNSQPLYFVVRAVDKAGNIGPYSNELMARPFAAPYNLTAQAISASEVQLMWPVIGIGADMVNIYFDIDRGEPYGMNLPSVPASATSTVVTGLNPATNYYFSITTTNAEGVESVYSNEANARTN